MKHSGMAIALAIGMSASVLSGCAMWGDRQLWYPQGPGDRVAATAQREAEAAEAQRAAQAQQSRGRALEVSPELVRQAPIPPRTPQAGAPGVAGAAAIAGGYTQATRYGDLLFVSGQIAMDLRTSSFNESATVEQQTRQVMENIRQILEAHRLTMANVVSATVYLRSMGDYRAMDAAYESFFRSNLPARSVVEVSRLPRNAAVEISVIAGR